MARGVLNRRKRHCKAADALLMRGGYTDTGKKKKPVKAVKMARRARSKKTDKIQAARALQLAPFSSFYTMVKLYNGSAFMAVPTCADLQQQRRSFYFYALK